MRLRLSKRQRHINTRIGVRKKYHLYFIEAPAVNAMKIGITSDLDQRIASIQHALPIEIAVAATVMGTARQEHALHLRFARIRMRGDWFVITDELRAFVGALKQMDERSVSRVLSRMRTPAKAKRVHKSTARVRREDDDSIRTAASRGQQRTRAVRLWSAVERMFMEAA